MGGARISKRIGMALVGALVAAALAGRTCGAIEVWMPDTGDVNLDELPRDSLEARLAHAAALIGAGQPMSGVKQLRGLLEEGLDAQAAEQARYLIAFGLFADGRHVEAFHEWEGFLELYPESERQNDAREMQLKAAILRAERNLDDGLALCETLIADAPTPEFALRCRKEKADAAMRAGDYLLAQHEYVVALEEYGLDTPWAPYCWYKIAECELALDTWLRRGTEHLERAGRAFRDFVEVYPEHELASEAEEKLAQVDAESASRYKMIAEYYLGPARHPTAALPYLHYLRTALSDTVEGKWAAKKIEELIADPSVPVPDRYRKLELPGVSPGETEETTEQPASPAGDDGLSGE